MVVFLESFRYRFRIFGKVKKKFNIEIFKMVFFLFSLLNLEILMNRCDFILIYRFWLVLLYILIFF